MTPSSMDAPQTLIDPTALVAMATPLLIYF